MSKNLQSPTKLTEFAPLQPEEKPQTVSHFITKLFKLARNEETSTSETASATQDAAPVWAKNIGETSSNAVPNIYPVDINEGRSLPNVLKRISNLLALKSNNLQDYADTEMKQYWMPDSVSKECYQCSEKFTTFRRRHHCRVCGQIFCSHCCNQQIPGKIFGCTGDLRVCTYCSKVVLSYLQSSNFGANLSTDLKALQEDLSNKFGDISGVFSRELSPSSGLGTSADTDSHKRKISVGYQEETFAADSSSVSYLTTEEKCKALQNSVSLRNLFEEVCKPTTGINFTSYKFRLRTYSHCFLGSELVDWLICQQKAKTRVQATALAQALLEGSYIESFSDSNNFVDGYVRYRKGNLFSPNVTSQSDNKLDLCTQEEPSWVQQIPYEFNHSDWDNEQISPSMPALTTSSSYKLDLNVGASSVYLSRPLESPQLCEEEGDIMQPLESMAEESEVVRPSEQRELAPESGWFNASNLREENGEKEAYELLTETYQQHEQSLLKQLLSAKGLPPSWGDILTPLIRDVICVIRPDKNHDAIQLDVRNYVQIKKLPGGTKSDTFMANGIVCSKNVAHKDMSVDIDNPRILLLECSIVYQRTEGRLMSLEPVMMQEQEYLRHVVARIAALRPDLVLVQKSVSRLAQDMLREHNITLVHNAKRTVLERLSKCTEADIVGAVDAHIGRPKLGSCKRFYLRKFATEKGRTKTLMCFEGLTCPHLGATVLLRGASIPELVKVKQVASFLIFTAYNWRLEKSILMDEFAMPPNSRIAFLDDSREGSPQSLGPPIEENLTKVEKKPTPKVSEPFTDPLQSTESKKIVALSVDDNSDPLQSTTSVQDPECTGETLTVADLPFSNRFKKHLDDTILCISPYVILPMPYLETDGGRRCKLRRFFFKDMYYSAQFDECGGSKQKRKIQAVDSILESEKPNSTGKSKSAPLHPFLTAKITNADDNRVQNMLAHFRACGGQYPKKEILDVTRDITNNQTLEPTLPLAERNLPDVLDPMNHQRLAVLFYSFSHESSNAPAFCVNPWVVYMDFYGKNDIPLGCFLERYCFRPTYACPSKPHRCLTPMVKHIRRFVHNTGSVTVSLNHFENEYAEEDIVMWSWCTKCTAVSPVVPLSADSWSYSFAKYLELRFHGEIFSRRGLNACRHSLHHDHYHYFGYKSYVASFKYSPINIWEIWLPPPVIELVGEPADRDGLIEEAKCLAQKGYDLFVVIADKAAAICGEELEGVGNIRQLLAKDQVAFKLKVEEVQLKLTSPTVEHKEFSRECSVQSYWKIKDSVTRIKASLVEVVDTWNVHLVDAIRKSDRKKEKPAAPEIESPVSEAIERGLLEAQKDVTEIENYAESFDDSSNKHLSDTTSSASHVEESIESKKESFKKEKSVKNILDKLLPSSGQTNPIQGVFPPEEHYDLPVGVYGSIPVFENEPSSIVAYALNSLEYKELTSKKGLPGEQNSSPSAKRKNHSEKVDDDKGGLLGFLRTKDSKTDSGHSQSSSTVECPETDLPSSATDKTDDAKKTKNGINIDIQFHSGNCDFFCCIYQAEKFANLRSSVVSGGEESYVRSLSRSKHWKAVGGKSGSNFAKTHDDRFILKEMPKAEVDMFLETSSNYFSYMQKCHGTQQPTLLAKIVGVYKTIYKNSCNESQRSYVLVMENLFYEREISQKFDLKGSMRNRLVVPDDGDGEIVLLDENLLKMTCDNPMYLLPHSKEVLMAAIHNDTDFLSSQAVMDYSLLVGLDATTKELVLGIIDYLRIFTWEKRLENMVKRTGILGGKGNSPTIISPEEYQKRFIDAMPKYFLEVPDHYTGMGKGLDIAPC